MYAILKQGGRQYRVSPGDVIQIDKLGAEKGTELDLDGVLMISDGDSVEVGAPRCDDFRVTAKVLREARGKKITVYKFKRRKGYARTQGHRQDFTEVKITGITKGGQPVAEQ